MSIINQAIVLNEMFTGLKTIIVTTVKGDKQTFDAVEDRFERFIITLIVIPLFGEH